MTELPTPGPRAFSFPQKYMHFPWFLHGFLMKPQTQSKQEITEHKFANPERVKVANCKVLPLILPVLPKQTNEPKKTKNKKPKKQKKTNKKKQDCTPQPSASDPLPLGCAILFFFCCLFFVFLFFLVLFFCFLIWKWVAIAHVPGRIPRHCEWLQRSACGRNICI